MGKTIIEGIHHVAITVADFDRSVEFYQALGMEVALAWGAKGADGDKRACMLSCGGGAHLELFAGRQGAERGEGAWQHIALTTPDCDAAWERAMAAGAKVKNAPFEVDIKGTPPARVRIAFCHGPDGEVVEFFQRMS